jgi:hypothetical protein
MTQSPACGLTSQTNWILRHLGKFRNILSPPRCASPIVRRPIVVRKRRVVESDVHMGGLHVFATPAKTEHGSSWI